MPLFRKSRPDEGKEQYLLKYARQGDTKSLEEILEMHRDSIKWYLKREFSNLELSDTEDAIQETFYQVARDIRKIQLHSASFRTYLFAIARKRCLDIIRGKTRHPVISTDEESFKEIPDTGNRDTDTAISKIDLSKALSLLSEYERLTIRLYFTDGKTLKTIASFVRKSEAQVSRDLAKTRKKLKKLLE